MSLRRKTQHGAALLVAMVVLTLVSTLAAGMVWLQSRAIEVESAERTRAQAAWILTGALDLGRVMLRLDARTPGADHLGEPWATRLEEASLSSLLAQDRNNNVEGAPEAFLGGGIRDAQERYNLRNLVEPATHKLVKAEVDALTRLCETAAVGPETAQTIATGLQAAWQAESAAAGEVAADAALAPQTVDQLVWLGLDAATARRLRPYVDLLPEPTPLNINTASAEVLAGVVAGLDAGSAKRLASRRPFKTLQDARGEIQGTGALDPKRLSVGSSYFEISGRLRMDGRVLEERLLVKRQNREVLPLKRTRQSLQPGSD
jgi:general secretion pathway protein K